MIIAVDFDGCLASAGTWPEVGEPNEALINWLICLRKRGDKVILWTCRADEALQKAVEFCKVHGQELDGSPAFYTSDEQIPGQMRMTEGG